MLLRVVEKYDTKEQADTIARPIGFLIFILKRTLLPVNYFK